jgi:hypothetical protein
MTYGGPPPRLAVAPTGLYTGAIGCLRATVSRPFPSWNRFILTEIYLCHACYCQEIFRTDTAGQVREQGIAGLYRGLVPALLGIMPVAGVDLAVYNTLKQRWVRQQQQVRSGRGVGGPSRVD